MNFHSVVQCHFRKGGNPVNIVGCPTKRAMPRLILGLINEAYLQVILQVFLHCYGVQNPTMLPSGVYCGDMCSQRRIGVSHENKSIIGRIARVCVCACVCACVCLSVCLLVCLWMGGCGHASACEGAWVHASVCLCACGQTAHLAFCREFLHYAGYQEILQNHELFLPAGSPGCCCHYCARLHPQTVAWSVEEGDMEMESVRVVSSSRSLTYMKIDSDPGSFDAVAEFRSSRVTLRRLVEVIEVKA